MAEHDLESWRKAVSKGKDKKNGREAWKAFKKGINPKSKGRKGTFVADYGLSPARFWADGEKDDALKSYRPSYYVMNPVDTHETLLEKGTGIFTFTTTRLMRTKIRDRVTGNDVLSWHYWGFSFSNMKDRAAGAKSERTKTFGFFDVEGIDKNASRLQPLYH